MSSMTTARASCITQALRGSGRQHPLWKNLPALIQSLRPLRRTTRCSRRRRHCRVSKRPAARPPSLPLLKPLLLMALLLMALLLMALLLLLTLLPRLPLPRLPLPCEVVVAA
jgi:hypothetical protein